MVEVVTLPSFVADNMSYSEDEQSLQAASAAKRRAHALVISTGVALETSPTTFATSKGSSVEIVVSALLDVISILNGTGTEGDISEIRTAAQMSVNQALRVMPAVSFITAVAHMSESGEPGVRFVSLSVLECAHNISTTCRYKLKLSGFSAKGYLQFQIPSGRVLRSPLLSQRLSSESSNCSRLHPPLLSCQRSMRSNQSA